MAEIEKGPVQAASNQETTDLIARLRTLQDNIPQDEELRKELYSTVRNLSLALESPIDTVKRICYLPIQLAMTKVAIDLGIFGVLNRPMSTVELETEVKSDAILLKRVLQYLASVGIIQRDGSDTFSPTKIARTLSIPGFQAAIRHHYEVHLPAWAALASFLADTSYANPSDEKKTAFQVAHHTDLPAYRWALTQPRLSRDFQLWMQAQRVGEKTWLDVVPRQYITAEGENAQPLFVDIGGGVGHQCAALLAAFPSVGRRVILQDLAPAIAHALPTPGVERVAHDFWEEQPIKGASVYYLRNVLHNYPDEKCITLLENTIEAMSLASVIFIDEIVLSDQQVHWQAAQLDITMMASLGAMERTRAQWLSLLDQAGLVVEEILRYTDEAAESLIIAVVK